MNRYKRVIFGKNRYKRYLVKLNNHWICAYETKSVNQNYYKIDGLNYVISKCVVDYKMSLFKTLLVQVDFYNNTLMKINPKLDREKVLLQIVVPDATI